MHLPHAPLPICTAQLLPPKTIYLTTTFTYDLLEMWNLDNMDSMLQREMVSLPTGTPAEFIGRNIAITAIQRAAMENFRHRTSK
jgi:hypothetical protein